MNRYQFCDDVGEKDLHGREVERHDQRLQLPNGLVLSHLLVLLGLADDNDRQNLRIWKLNLDVRPPVKEAIVGIYSFLSW